MRKDIGIIKRTGNKERKNQKEKIRWIKHFKRLLHLMKVECSHLQYAILLQEQTMNEGQSMAQISK